MKASIILTTYRRPTFLLAVLQSIARQTLGDLDYELLVINDGPNDATEYVATRSRAAKSLNIRYIHSGTREGQKWRTMGFAANIGIQQAVGEIVVLSNSDMYHVGTTVVPVIEYCAKDPMAISTVAEVYDDDGSLIKHLTTYHHMWTRARERIIDGIRTGPRPPGLFPTNPDMPFFMAIRREHLLNVGGYDEDFTGCASEDCDLLHRLLTGGCYYHYGEPDSELIHLYHGRRSIAELEADPGFAYNICLRKMRRRLLVRNAGRKWGQLDNSKEGC